MDQRLTRESCTKISIRNLVLDTTGAQGSFLRLTTVTTPKTETNLTFKCKQSGQDTTTLGRRTQQ